MQSADEAEAELANMLASGALPQDLETVTVVLEEYLEGPEVSAQAFSDGQNIVMMPPACDYKRLLDGDAGPMTGGMGAYSPTRLVTPELWAQIERDILTKAVAGMRDEGVPFRGFLYAGLMLTSEGPKVLEFNSRLGDPETQVLMPMLKTPFEDIAMSIAQGDLSRVGKIEWSDDAAVGVVIAADNYPAGQLAVQPLGGLFDLDEGMLVFHAGTQLKGASALNVIPYQATSGSPRSMLGTLFGRSRSADLVEPLDAMDPQLTAKGGRLLTVVARAGNIAEARDKVYRNIDRIKLTNVQYRHDIGARELEK